MKGKGKSIQPSMFSSTELYGIPEDTRPEVPMQEPEPEVVIEQPQQEQYRPRVALGVEACPVCGSKIAMYPDGTIRCGQCWWCQGNNE